MNVLSMRIMRNERINACLVLSIFHLGVGDNCDASNIDPSIDRLPVESIDYRMFNVSRPQCMAAAIANSMDNRN